MYINNQMFTVYILQSERNQKYYIGHTADINQRLKSHNLGHTKSTKAFRPWKIIYTESVPSRQLAYKREQQIKKYKGGRAFKELIQL